MKAAEPEKKDAGEGDKKVERRRGEGGRRGGRGDGRPRGDRPPRERREPRVSFFTSTQPIELIYAIG